jgi:para-nitrobenzyl esterase
MLVEKGGVLVVTLNYRLGILGFLSHPALTAESPYGTSGNYGLMDQQAALRWVHANIARFGGDPENVTIFGESSGGVSVHANLASPSAAGLFHKAIIESGAVSPYALTELSLTESEALGTEIAGLLGCSSQTAVCLRSLSVPTILAVQDEAFSNIISPSVDGKTLPLSTGEASAIGQFNRVPIIEGSNHDEYRFFVGEAELLTGAPLSPAGYIPTIEADLGLPASLAAYIGTDIYPLAAYPSPSLAMGALGTDAVFACNARALAGLFAQYVPTYQYEFNDPNAPFFAGLTLSFPPGSYHSAEIQYLMGVDERLLVDPGPQTPAQVELSDAMIQYWTHFAKTGNPNSSGAPHWPRYGKSDLFQSLEPPKPVTQSDFAIDHKCAIWAPSLP